MGPAHKDLSGNMTPGEKEEFPMLRLDGGPLIEEDLVNLQKPKKPSKWCSDVDKGWSWIVLFATFCMFLLGNGAQFAFGVMYSSIRRHFNTSKSTTSWILLLQRGTGSIFGKYTGYSSLFKVGYLTYTQPHLSLWTVASNGWSSQETGHKKCLDSAHHRKIYLDFRTQL